MVLSKIPAYKISDHGANPFRLLISRTFNRVNLAGGNVLLLKVRRELGNGAASGMRTGNDKEEVRRARVRQLFETRYPGERTETEVLAFYGWLKEHHPEMLPRKRHGDRYQDFESDLYGLYKAT